MALFIVTATLVKRREIFFFFLLGLVTLTHRSHLRVRGCVCVNFTPVFDVAAASNGLCVAEWGAHTHTAWQHIYYTVYTYCNTLTHMKTHIIHPPPLRWFVLPLYVVRPSTSVWLSRPQQRPVTETGNSWREESDTGHTQINQLKTNGFWIGHEHKHAKNSYTKNEMVLPADPVLCWFICCGIILISSQPPQQLLGICR